MSLNVVKLSTLVELKKRKLSAPYFLSCALINATENISERKEEKEIELERPLIEGK